MKRWALAAAVGAVVLVVAGSAGAEAPTPVIVSSDPASPADDGTPVLHGTAVALADVAVYTNDTCSGDPAGTGVAGALGDFAIQVSVPDDTTTTFFATATDPTGTSPCSSGFTYVEDSTPPPAPSIVGPADPSSDTTPAFSFTDAEPGVTFHCRLDGGAYPPCDTPTTRSVGEGPHTFSVKAIDAAGNASEASYSWTVDTTPPPAPTIVDGPPTPSASTSATFAFSGEAGASFLCSLDGGAFAPCANPATFTVPDGDHTLAVEAVDAAQNVSQPSPSYAWTVDTVHPLVTITAKPQLVTNRTTADFAFTSGPGASAYECRLDAATFGACASPQHYAGLRDGSHAFSVRSISAGGSRSAATSYAWSVDTVPPETTIRSAPTADSASRSASFAFVSSEPGSSFACSVDATGFGPCSSPKAYAGLGDGRHTFRVQAVDRAGNADASPATYTWRISGVGPPTADLTPPENVTSLARRVAYRRLVLRWRRPADPDFDHVSVFVSTRPSSAPRTAVYTGTGQSYTDRRFRNGFYYRYLVVSYDHAANASRGAATVVPASALLLAPRNGSVVRRTPTFRWVPVRGASFYNIQLYRRGTKVLSAWPKRPRQLLTRRWAYGGHSHALRKGSYAWYVWPGFGRKARSRYGPLLGQGTFRVR